MTRDGLGLALLVAQLSTWCLLPRGLEALNASQEITLRDTTRPPCVGPFQHHIHLHVHHIMSIHASSGVTNKNAADTLGDMAFIFGSKGYPTPRGVEQYYDGIIETIHVSVSSWGDYLQCNHADHSTVYSCTCPKDHKGTCDMKRPGKEESSHTNGHTWYSFPHAGQGYYWDYEHGGGCAGVQIHASCVIDKLASKAGCPGQCSATKAKECVQCVNKLSDAEKQKVFDDATFGEGCPDSRRRRSSTDRRRYYERAPCREGEEWANMDVGSKVVGEICTPWCKTSTRTHCPTNPKPHQTTARSKCVVTDSKGRGSCALVCTKDSECPTGAKCHGIGGGDSICTFPHPAGRRRRQGAVSLRTASYLNASNDVVVV